MAKKTRSKQETDPERSSRGHETTQSGAENPKDSKPLAVGASVRVSRLDTLKACRAELGKLYREARKRSGRYPDALTAKRLADVLAGVRNAIEMEDFEHRLQELEERLPLRRGRY